MTLPEKIQAVLAGTAGITALTTAARIKTGFVGQTLPRPYLAHFPVAERETRKHGGRALLQIWAYQVSCFGDDAQDAIELAQAVVAALGSYKSGGIVVIGAERGPYTYDDTTRVHHVPVTLEIADRLT